jgi:hypothetical protein
MASPDRVAAVLAHLEDLAPSGFFDRSASELVSRLPDRLRGSLAYLAGHDERLTARALLTEERLGVLSDEVIDELG